MGEIVMAVLDLVGTAIIFGTSFIAVWELSRIRKQRREVDRMTRIITEYYGVAIALPESLPKTFPDNIHHLHSLPVDIQRNIVRYLRDEPMGRAPSENHEID